MSSPDLVRTQLRSLLAAISGGAPFNDDQDVFASGIVRSINLLELIVGVEDAYRIVVDERDVFEGRLRSIDSLVAFVVERRRLAS